MRGSHGCRNYRGAERSLIRFTLRARASCKKAARANLCHGEPRAVLQVTAG